MRAVPSKLSVEVQELGGSRRNTYRLHGGNDLTVWLEALWCFIDIDMHSSE